MILAWLGKNFLGLTRGWWLAIAFAAALAAYFAFNAFVDRAFDEAEQTGAVKAVNAGHETTLDQVGKANAAGDKVRDDRDGARFDQCMRDSAPGFESGCERYRPLEPVPGRP